LAGIDTGYSGLQLKRLSVLTTLLVLLLICAGTVFAQRSTPSGWVEDTSGTATDTPDYRSRPLATTSPPAKQPGQSAKPAQAPQPTKFMLKGQVEHSDRLPPTAEELRPGADFRASSIPTVRETSEWYRIPAWFAGNFAVEQSVVSKSYTFLTGQTTFLNKRLKTQAEESHGFQKDAHGDIWHLSTTSGTSSSQDQSRYIYNIVQWYGPEEINEGRVVMRILATTVVVNKQTRKVEDVIRREDIKSYVPLNPGTVSVSYTSKSFSPEGIPLDLQTGFSVHKRIAPFKAIDQMGETDVRELFRQFLISNNLANLVPASSRL